jgi:hypothetical protein
MARQIDIVVLEPFYGGVRKDTLELLARNSRNRWTVYKLPARRLERRLNTAAQWFHQQMSRSGGVHCDAVFTSDAMNLADFVRLNPEFGRKPIIAYFYCNPLAGEAAADQQARVAILATASCATEIWFGSLSHMKEFLLNAAALHDAHAELGGKEPLRALIAKSQLMFPPVELTPPAKDPSIDAERKGRTVCIDNREGPPMQIIREVIANIAQRREPVAVHVIGKMIENMPEGVPVVQIDPRQETEVARACRRSELFISSQAADKFDPMPMFAMTLGCIPVLPKTGYFSEFLPKALHPWCLYDATKDDLLNRITDLWYLRRPAVARKELDAIFARYLPITATRCMDQRIAHLVQQFQVA